MVNIAKLGLIVIVFVGLFSGGAYYGVKLWGKYADSLSPEEKAAIIGGIFGILSVGCSVGFTAYFHSQSQKLTLRDEMIKTRLQVYQQLYFCCADLMRRVYLFLLDPNPDTMKNLEEQCKKASEYMQRNRFYLSEEMFDKVAYFTTVSSWLHLLPGSSGVYFMSGVNFLRMLL